MKKIIPIIRFIGFWAVFSILSIIATTVSGIGNYVKVDPHQMALAGLFNFIVTLAYAGLVAFITVNSTVRGIKLILTLFWAFFGINGFLAQIESVVFLKYLVNILPAGALPHIVLAIGLQAIVLAVLAPLFYGKISGSSEKNPDSGWLRMKPAEWLWKLSLIGAVYVVIYFLFGNFVAKPIAGEVFNQYYKNLKIPTWILAFQFGRGIIWASTAIPVMFILKGSRGRTGLLVSLMFAVFIGLAMIVPNPFFPDRMRYAHLVELLSSMFVFGWLATLIFSLGRKAGGKG